QQARRLVVHPFEIQQVLGDVADRLLAHDRLGQQRVARAAAQFVDRVLVEGIDLEHLVQRHVGDFLQRGESFLDQDIGHFLVDVELVDEQRTRALAFDLMLLLRFLDAHQVDFPPGELGGQGTFWPLRPIAIARFSSSTTTSMLCRSSSTTMLEISAGESALITSLAGSSENRTMSTRSPASSLVTAVTRDPRMPMQVPCGSSRGSFDFTAILARTP